MKKLILKIGYKRLSILLLILVGVQLVMINNRNERIGGDAHAVLRYAESRMGRVLDTIRSEEMTFDEKRNRFSEIAADLGPVYSYADSPRTLELYNFTYTIFTENIELLLEGNAKAIGDLETYEELLSALNSDLDQVDSHFTFLDQLGFIKNDHIGTYYYLTYWQDSIIADFDAKLAE